MPDEYQDNIRVGTIFRRHPDLIFKAAIGLAIGTGLCLRWSGLNSQSFWADEGYTLWISRFSPKEMWLPLQRDTAPPLYYTLLHYWMGLFGTSESSLRALSALFATLSLLLFYLVARKIAANRTSVVLATALYSISFFQIWYAKELRFYALLAFLSVANVYLALRCLERTSVSWLLTLGLTISASLYTHNIAWFYLPGLAVFWFIYPAKANTSDRVKGAVIAGAVAFILYLPWLPSFSTQLRLVYRSFWVPTPSGKDLLQTFCVLGGFDTVTFQAMFRNYFHSQKLFGILTWGPAFLAILAVSIFGLLYDVGPANRRKSIALLTYSILPVILVFFDSRLSNSIYIVRVFIGAAVLWPLVFCAPIAFQTGTRRMPYRFTALIVLVAATISLIGYLHREQKEDWRGVTEYLMRIPERRRLVVVARDYCQILVRFYSTGLFKSYPPIEITGLSNNFDLTNLSFGAVHERTVSKLAKEIESRRYNEIDFALQSSAEQAKSVKGYLRAHCSSIETVQFHSLEVQRCFVQSQ